MLPFFVLPVDALGVRSNRQRPPGGDPFFLYLNLPGGVENVALLFGLFNEKLWIELSKSTIIMSLKITIFASE